MLGKRRPVDTTCRVDYGTHRVLFERGFARPRGLTDRCKQSKGGHSCNVLGECCTRPMLYSANAHPREATPSAAKVFDL
jgi:hypothetical protein